MNILISLTLTTFIVYLILIKRNPRKVIIKTRDINKLISLSKGGEINLCSFEGESLGAIVISKSDIKYVNPELSEYILVGSRLGGTGQSHYTVNESVAELLNSIIEGDIEISDDNTVFIIGINVSKQPTDSKNKHI